MKINIDVLLSKWIISNVDHDKIHDNCLKFAIELEDCIETCKTKEKWKDQKECFQKCAKSDL